MSIDLGSAGGCAHVVSTDMERAPGLVRVGTCVGCGSRLWETPAGDWSPVHVEAAPLGGAVEAVAWDCRVMAESWSQEATDWAIERLYGRDAGPRDVHAADFARLGCRPELTVEGPRPGNLTTTAGLTALSNRLFVAEATRPKWAVSAAGSGWVLLSLGDCDSSVGAAITDTVLAGSNQCFRMCDDTYPQWTAGAWTLLTTFQSGDANYGSPNGMNEYGAWVPANSSATAKSASSTSTPANYSLLNHRRPAGLGFKSAGTLALTMNITLT